MQITQIYPYTLGPSNAEISSAMISDDCKLVGALVDGHPVLQRLGDHQVDLSEEVRSRPYQAAALSPGGRYLALGEGRQLAIVTLESGVVHRAPSAAMHHLVWDINGERLIAGHRSSKLSFWNPEAECLNSFVLRAPRSQRNWLISLGINGKWVFSASSFPLPNWICASSEDRNESRLRLPAGTFVHGLIPWRDGVLGLLSDHAARFELVAYDYRLKPQPVQPVLLDSDVTALSAHPRKSWLALGTVNGELWILDTDTLCISDKTLLWHAPIRTLSTCAANCVVAGANDGQLKLIELFE